MTYQQLQCFLSVAELLSFTKAASRHYMAQSAISQQISAMEKELNVELFVRSTHNVSLTPAGKAFYNAAAQAYQLLNSGIINAKNIQSKNAQEMLRVGYVGAPEESFLPKTIWHFQKRCPDVHLELVKHDTAFALNLALQESKCDAGFLFSYETDGSGRLESVPILEFPICIFLPKDHPLAAEECLRRDQIPQDIPCTRPSTDHNQQQSGGLLFTEPEQDPEKFLITDSIFSCMMLIGAGLCYGIFPSYVQSICNSAVSCVPLEDSGALTQGGRDDHDTILVLAWPKNHRTALTDALLDSIRDANDGSRQSLL